MADPKRKRDDLSSTSSLDTSRDISISEDNPSTEKPLSKGQKKKKTKLVQKELELNLNMPTSVKETKKPENKNPAKPKEKDKTKPNKTITDNVTMEISLAKINDKLSKVLTKDDHSFLKNIIKETILELKENFLESVTNRIEKLEGEIHEIAIENKKLKSEITTLKESQNNSIEEIETDKTIFKTEIETKNLKMEETIHDHEQYSRRNNIRIHNMPDDSRNETSLQTTFKVLDTINQNLDLNLTPQSIDIAHRLGPYTGRNRRVIVKFVHRQVKHMIMEKASWLKGTGIIIFEDLTQLHNKVLASARKKSPDEVDEAWYRNGGIYIKWKASGTVEKLAYKDYQTWLDLPWIK